MANPTANLTAAELDAVNMIGIINVEYRLKDEVEDIVARAKLWASELSQYPNEIVKKALHNVICTSTFPPRLADIKNEIERIYSVLDPSPEELWARMAKWFPVVARNASGYRYNFVEPNGKTQGENYRAENESIYNALPDAVRLYVRNVSELVELSRTADEALTYERARFIKRVPELKAQIRLKNSLPREILAIVSNASAKLQTPTERKRLGERKGR